ncbi:hypothetical protein A1Q2_03103 [Trichosporon asahii var. asahii CBS 8904]|uniref:Uncharacterized protein n=1 Tax=Trichosporon asahii var. asahii (strain CBS 8904) TaxID=1220162 RepID=K1VPN5_TRIAC|nr:hypothetical protein A1Q2_03103 [Trichosporon asahii var. asahii CBS 8904]
MCLNRSQSAKRSVHPAFANVDPDTVWTFSEWTPGDRLPTQIIGWEINTANALPAMRWLMAGAKMRQASLVAYQQYRFCAPDTVPPNVPLPIARLFLPPAVPPGTPIVSVMDALYVPNPQPPATRACAPTPHCGAISGLWPIDVYDSAAVDLTNASRIVTDEWWGTEDHPPRFRGDEAYVLFHAAVLETTIVFNALCLLRNKAFSRMSDEALSATFANPLGPLADWPDAGGWPRNEIADLVTEQSRRWRACEAIKLGIQWHGHLTGTRANWMLERPIRLMIDLAQFEKRLLEIRTVKGVIKSALDALAA